MAPRIAVIGLGYVGLPVAVGFSEAFPDVIGFDIDNDRVAALRDGEDRTGEIAPDRLRNSRLRAVCEPAELKDRDLFIICVPTPIHKDRRPDLRPLAAASETVGKALRPGAIVVYESTVYPGVTEEFCGPILARASGLSQGVDFKLGYSPERINPGDREHPLEKIVKIVSGQDEESLEIIAGVYEQIIDAGVHRASSIKVAEAAKIQKVVDEFQPADGEKSKIRSRVGSAISTGGSTPTLSSLPSVPSLPSISRTGATARSIRRPASCTSNRSPHRSRFRPLSSFKSPCCFRSMPKMSWAAPG